MRGAGLAPLCPCARVCELKRTWKPRSRVPCLAQVPVNLLRAGRIFVFEPPPGVKANMLRTFSSIPVSRICKVSAGARTRAGV